MVQPVCLLDQGFSFFFLYKKKKKHTKTMMSTKIERGIHVPAIVLEPQPFTGKRQTGRLTATLPHN